MTKITDEMKRGRLGALFAVSNYGLEHHIREMHYNDPSTWTGHAEFDVVTIASSIIENEDMQEIFEGEARSWENRIADGGFEKYKRIFGHYPWVAAIIDME